MKLRDEAEKAKQREQLFAIQRTLKEIRKQQLTINADTEKTVDRIREAGRLTRRDTRAVRNCAQQQEAQIQQLEQRSGQAVGGAGVSVDGSARFAMPCNRAMNV